MESRSDPDPASVPRPEADSDPGSGALAQADDPPVAPNRRIRDRTAKAIKPQARDGSLYGTHQKVYPRAISGRYRTLKWIASTVLLAIFWIGPWIRWDRGPNAPDQAIFIDLPGRKAYFFAIEIWPQEVYYVTGLLIILALLLFFSTALLGRVWCGYACFQTVFTDLFVAVERLVEGSRNTRMARDAGPWGPDKILRKLAKTAVWLAIALAAGAGFALYFHPDPATTLAEIATLQAGGATLGTVAVVGGFCFLLAGYAREQVCIYMCPYARFQAAMMDEESTIVTYEAWRGEPREKYSRDADFSQRGHCVDCGLCVQVCPTGIDIRDGNQLACIGCGLCADACDQVMERFDLPKGLVAYDSVANQRARAEGGSQPIRWLRPRTLIYGGLLALAVAVMSASLATRSRIEVNVLHERSPLFVTMSDGTIRNGYTFKVLNMRRQDAVFALVSQGLEGATLEVVALTEDPVTEVRLPVAGDSVGTFRLYVSVPRAALSGPAEDVDLVLTNTTTGETLTSTTLFAGPE